MKHKTLKTMLMIAMSAVVLANPAGVKAGQAETNTVVLTTVSAENAAADNEAVTDKETVTDASAEDAETAETTDTTQAAVKDSDASVAGGTAQAEAEDKDAAAAENGGEAALVSDQAASGDVKTYDLSDPEGYAKALAKAKGTDELTGVNEEGNVDDLTNMYGIFDITGLKYEKNNPAGNLTRLNRHVTYDYESYSSADYIHQNYLSVCGKAGYILFSLPAGYGDKVASFELLESSTEGSSGTIVATFNKSNTKTVYKINSPSFFSDKDCYAVYYNKFNTKKPFYYTIRPRETGGAYGDSGYSYRYVPSPDMVSNVETTSVSASKVKITWPHDNCVNTYEVYRSLKHVQDFTEDENTSDLTKYERIGTVSGSAALKKGRHFFVDKKVPDADNSFYYIIKPIITPQLAQEEYYDILFCSDPVAGQASVSDAKVKALNVNRASLDKFKLSWKGLKNVKQYTITRFKNNEYDYEFVYDIVKKDKAVHTYTDSDFNLGVNYYYTIRPTSDSADGKKTKSAVVRSVPASVSGLKTDKRGNNRGAYVSWTDNSSERKAAENLGYEYRYEIKIDNGDWIRVKSNGYDDTSSLSAGSKRTYTVRAACIRGSKVVASDEATCTFKVSDSITLKNGDGSDMSSDTMYVAVKNTSYYRAYSSSGSNMSIKRADDNSNVEFSGYMRDGYLYITLRGNRVGEQRVEITSDGGGRKEVTIKVVSQ